MPAISSKRSFTIALELALPEALEFNFFDNNDVAKADTQGNVVDLIIMVGAAAISLPNPLTEGVPCRALYLLSIGLSRHIGGTFRLLFGCPL